MFRFFTPILILQAFCIYHAYKTGKGQTWFYLIIFLPFIGSLIYLYDTFLTRKNLDDLSEGIKQAINSNRKIELLEKQLRLANTQNNRIALANAYLEIGRAEDAIKLLSNSPNLQSPQPDILFQLIEAHYLIKDYTSVVKYGNLLKNNRDFKNSDARIAYAWSLHYAYDNEKAQEEFEGMNVRFSNYKHRFKYAKFLLGIQNHHAGMQKLEELIAEYQDMSHHEKRYKKNIYRAAQQLYANMK